MSAITDKWLKAVPLYTDTLAGAISNATVTTFQVTNGSTDLENGEVYEVTIDRVTAQGVSTGRREVVIAQYTSATKTFDCSSADYRGIEGAAQAHPVGAVVEILVTAHYLNEHRAAFLAQHNQDGTHNTTYVVTPTGTQTLTNKTLTSPKVETAILDANGNEVIKTPATASAVNEVTIINSATGNAVQLAVSGGDTNIDIAVLGKGSGSVKLGAAGLKFPNSDGTAGYVIKTDGSGQLSFVSQTTDGWTAVTDTWTYASDSTITVPSGAASLYQNGDRIRLKQGGGYKYYVLTAVADTLLTVAVNTDYTVANAAITDVYYSHQANPIGYPHWFNCVPTTSASGSMTFSIDSNLKAKFCVIGSMCTFTFGFVGTTGGTPDYYAYVTLPITAQSVNCSSGSGIMKNTHGYGLGIISDTGKCAFRKYDGGTMSNGQSYSIGTITYPF